MLLSIEFYYCILPEYIEKLRLQTFENLNFASDENYVKNLKVSGGGGGWGIILHLFIWCYKKRQFRESLCYSLIHYFDCHSLAVYHIVTKCEKLSLESTLGGEGLK